jgi:hypothetical protein
VADVLPAAFTDWRCDVVALDVEQAFWEKATILCVEYRRPAGRSSPDRFGRQYADTAALATHPKARARGWDGSTRVSGSFLLQMLPRPTQCLARSAPMRYRHKHL